uniref:Transmembrane protein n=1 Tax=Ananas comosus var. bracteatus TaxID=296719 RepID=A0A6V7P4J5_ANACO|nr:unnamed protein product [Ananas comosus var. bracteatus]
MAFRVPSLLTFIFLLFSLPFCISHGLFELRSKPKSEKHELILLRRLIAEEVPPSTDLSEGNGSFVLAAERTRRRDPLDEFKEYTGGWNISNEHYWTSVAFTAIPLLVIASVWLVGFGLALFFICCCYCCCRRQSYSYSRAAYALSLILLILFTLAAIVGCIVLYKGQGRFHASTTNTLKYVVGQADLTVDNLRNFSGSLASAKKAGVNQIFLPANVQSKIDVLDTKLNSSANALANRTANNSKKIKNVLDAVRLDLIIVAAVMLVLTFLGFLLSVLGIQFLVSVLVLIGWILVAGTFILCGVFLLLHNVVADTCVAMDEWVTHPRAHTALDDILPCVDIATANESLYRSKEVTFQLVNLVNQVILNVSNKNFPPMLAPLYYNQSGPLMPILCNPYTSDMSNRTCVAGEVGLDRASQVWKGYKCRSSVVSGADVCTTEGRVTPALYDQMTAAVSISRGLYDYGPFLSQLLDCTFVRETFTSISSNNCPSLDEYTRWIYVGLLIVSAAVMLSLVFWVAYARERRHRMYNKQFLARSSQAPYPLREKSPYDV